MKAQFMARDQFGNTYHGLLHPRKDLMERLGVSHADKMFIDGKDGKGIMIGYVIAGKWLTIYKVEPFEKKVGK